MALSTDWDINDSVVPKVDEHELNELSHWPDGHCRRVYSDNSEDVKKHTTGWAMRNTNNHNVNILKKSCLGLFVCTRNCVSIHGKRTQIRPAICDKARKKQRNKPCPNTECDGQLAIQPCRGHSGYPVTHFWRTIGDKVYFQAKGTHDHPRPEPKGHQTKYATKRKSKSIIDIDSHKHKIAITNKIRDLRLSGSSRRATNIESIADKGVSTVLQQPFLNSSNSTKSTVAPTQTVTWSPNQNNIITSQSYPDPQNQKQHPEHNHQLAKHHLPLSDIEYNKLHSFESNLESKVPQNHNTTNNVLVNEFLRPEDIFQLDQPIVNSISEYYHYHHAQQNSNQFGYSVSTCSNSMSPSSLTSSSSSSTSQSPPCTFLDLESGRIQQTKYHTNNMRYECANQYESNHSNYLLIGTKSDVMKYEASFVHSANNDDADSIFNEFDETYTSFQQHVQNNELGVYFGVNSFDMTDMASTSHIQLQQQQQPLYHNNCQYDLNCNVPTGLEVLTNTDEWIHI